MKQDNLHTPPDYDIIIVGGGLVGASLACALKTSGLQVAVIETQPFAVTSHPGFDARTVALAYTSKQIFQALGLWHALEQAGVAAIKHIHISDRGHLGQTQLHAADMQTEALGYVVENRILGKVLSDAMAQQNNVTYLAPMQVDAFETTEDHVTVTCHDKAGLHHLTARLLVAADGGQSSIRMQAAVKTRMHDYAQCALVANVEMDRPHENIAYERFTDCGPLALLPLPDNVSANKTGNAYSLVWTLPRDEADMYMSLSDAELTSRLQSRLGKRAGQVTHIGQRVMFPLYLVRAVEHVTERLAFIGNAAHTLHPVAGQGFNLGLRDVAALAEELVNATRQAEDIGSMSVLTRYARWRSRDQKQTILVTDTLVRLFSNNLLPFALARNMALLALDTLPRAKYKLTRQAMGYIGKVSRLARGISL